MADKTAHPFGLEALTAEIQCYALPFGALGTVSHALTLYTSIMLACGLSPWLLRPNKAFQMDATLAGVGLLIVLGTTIATLVKCRQRWEFVLVAFWKLALSVSLNGLSLAAAGYVQSEDAIAKPERTGVKIQYSETEWDMPPMGGHTMQPGDRKEIGREEYQFKVSPFFSNVEKGPASRYWLAIGFQTVGCIIGVVGLQSLVREIWDYAHIRYLCYGFGGAAGFLVVIILIVRFLLVRYKDMRSDRLGGMFASILITLGFLALFWSDWVLAFIKQDATGVPDGNNAVIGWFYFVAKRLTMFSA
ncbi:hypothetical protein B0T16DRAFT_458834 [Cercophora newfieldiana]|uniref:Uncharacterized protein n=1 Tax=Cercophora newfieldiana TaxID=92897 RepID=A0AA39Y751_9PEZI|nr:hypothetical protein B0T16DRAFT_458834 [Cercophora newfieldiana]